MKPTRAPGPGEPSGLGSARAARVVLHALAARPGRRRADPNDRAAVARNAARNAAEHAPADMVAPAAAYD
ncbi:MAG: hypothetical protein ACRET0_09745, partial [Steroidobacteraceae bacterium]